MTHPLENCGKNHIPTRSTIGRKLVGIVLIAVATTLLIATVASSWLEISRYSAAKSAEIRGTAFVFSAAVAEPLALGDRIGILRALRAIGQVPHFVHAGVENADGQRIAELGATVALEERADLPVFLRKTLDVRVPIKKAGVTIGHLTVLADTSDLKEKLIGNLLIGLLAALSAAAVGILIAIKLQHRITDPLRRLTQSMLDVQQTSDFSRNVKFSSNDETGLLVDSFNGMMTQIRDRDNRLADHLENLERTVEERTIDYREAKEAAEDANAAKSDFLATMSHEIRTPMNGMLVMAELLASAELTDRHRRYADVVVKSGQSLLAIINDILDFSKIESGKMDLEAVALDPGELVDDVLSLFWEKASSKGVDLSAYVAADVPVSVEGDPVRLNQILSNLVNNALKFTEDGHVCITVTTARRLSRGGATGLRFAVSDTGIGIPEDKLDTIFESFSQADQSTTRKFGGTGLGLAICKRLVTAMDGELNVTSTYGEGSEFSFTMKTRDLSEGTNNTSASASTSQRNAIVALSGSATVDTMLRYLNDRNISARHIEPDHFTPDSIGDAAIVFADPGLIGGFLQTSDSAGPPKPFAICVSQMGDTRSDAALEAGSAHDVLMRPISRKGFGALIDRLADGKPLGRKALQSSKAAETPRFTGVSVLVADDSPVNREVVIEALKQLDVRADVVEDGQQALEQALRQDYDLIFMDCSMPVMDGFEATRHIRAAETERGSKRVPIVALTAHVAGTSADAWRDAGMDAYLTKPFRLTDLSGCFETFVGPGEIVQVEPDTSDRDNAPVATQPPSPPPEEPTDNAIPVIDDDVLDGVAACSPGAGQALVLKVLGLFESHAPAALLKLAETAQTDNHKTIGEAAHALKSMARNIGANRLAEACGVLEAEARSGDVVELKSRLVTIHQCVVDALAEIKRRKSADHDTRRTGS